MPSPTTSNRPKRDLVLERFALADLRVLSLPEGFVFIDEVSGSRSKSEWLVRRLVSDGALVRVRRGLYAVRSPRGTIPVSTLELVARTIPEGGFITGGRALMHWELNDQWSHGFTVITDKNIDPWSWRRDTVSYVRVPESKLWGSKSVRTPSGKVRVARPERAIVDALAHPAAGVGMAQVAQAISNSLAKDPQFGSKLASAAKRYRNQRLIRRCAVLVSALGGSNASDSFRRLRREWTDVIPLSTSSDNQGPVDPLWRVRENIPIEMLAGRAAQRD